MSRGKSGQQELMTVEEVARMLRLEPETVRAHARRGDLPAIKVGNRLRFDPEKLQAHLEAQAVQPTLPRARQARVVRPAPARPARVAEGGSVRDRIKARRAR